MRIKTTDMRMKTTLFFLVLVPFPGVFSQSVPEIYIEEALQSNITFQNTENSYFKSLEALKEARGAFLPTISLVARYTTAEGQNQLGISSEELTGPLFTNLDLINQTLAGIVPGYPEIPPYVSDSDDLNNALNTNQQTAVLFSLPLFNAVIIRNHALKKKLTEVENLAIEIHRRQLVREVKLAYFQYLQTRDLESIAAKASQVAAASVEVAEALYLNDKATKEDRYTAEANHQQARIDQLEAANDVVLARTYFNFLLNRPGTAAIRVDSTAAGTTMLPYDLTYYQQQAALNRPELTQLAWREEAARAQVRLNKAAGLPKISIGLETGFRGNEYAFNGETSYYQMGGQVTWDIFTGFRNNARNKQAEIDNEIVSNQKKETENQLLLAVTEAYHQSVLAREKIAAVDIRAERSEQSFQLVKTRYANGLATRYEYEEAEAAYINTLQQKALAVYDYEAKKVILNYEAGL